MTSPQRYVSSEELAGLADRLTKIDSSKLGELLDPDKTNAVRENDNRPLYMLLTTWRDEQEIGSDIRSCLAGKLRRDFPEESDFLLHAGKKDGRPTYHTHFTFLG